jgi:diguanylate cyclase (GGDEF)-like protein
MTEPALSVKNELLRNCLSWFQGDFLQRVVSLVVSRFPSYPHPQEVQSVLAHGERIREMVEARPPTNMVDLTALFESPLTTHVLPLFKQIVLRYRRNRAAYSDVHREKTFHAGIIQMVNEEINTLDAVVATNWFQMIGELRLPRAMDFLPVQYIEKSDNSQGELMPRRYDEKFHILQSPALFLPDLAYFRAKCELRDAPLTVAFLDIDDFKSFNTTHTETKADRNLLPHFMQTVEAHVYHHGFAYRQGGDEYLMLIPSLSKELVLTYLDELRLKLADLKYLEITGAPTVSIGVCVAEPDCFLTDRELLDRANQAKKFAKDHRKNCIATYDGPQLIPSELCIVRPEKSGA